MFANNALTGLAYFAQFIRMLLLKLLLTLFFITQWSSNQFGFFLNFLPKKSLVVTFFITIILASLTKLA